MNSVNFDEKNGGLKRAVINNFSVVPSPNGVSIRYEGADYDPEVCISVKDGRLVIGVYYDDKDFVVIDGEPTPYTQLAFVLDRRE